MDLPVLLKTFIYVGACADVGLWKGLGLDLWRHAA